MRPNKLPAMAKTIDSAFMIFSLMAGGTGPDLPT
jgi:hypothetical protein